MKDTLTLVFILIYLCNRAGAQDMQERPARSDSFDRNHSFLWFTGHWSTTKKNTFILDSSYGKGGTVTVGKGGSVSVQTGNITSWNKRMDDAMKDIDQTEQVYMKPQSMINEIAKNINKRIKPELDSIRAFATNLKIQKDEALKSSPSPEETAGQKLAGKVKAGCEKFKPRYEEIMNFMATHKKDKDDDLVNPPPPEFNYDCYSCDSSLRKYYLKRVRMYTSLFMHPESDMIADILDFYRQFVLLGLWSDILNGTKYSGDEVIYEKLSPLLHINKKDPAQSGACAYLEPKDLKDALYFLMARIRRRAFKLLKDNNKNFAAVEAVTSVVLQIERNSQLMGFTPNEDRLFAELSAIYSRMREEYMDRLFKLHEWSQLGNIPFILGLSRQECLFGSKEDESMLTKIFNLLNNFKLTVDMDIKVGGDGTYMLVHVKGYSKIAPQFDPDENQCFRWVLASDELDPVGLPMKSATQELKVSVLANDMIAPGPKFEYIGTKTYITDLKQLRMNFCDPGKDTIILSNFRPDPPMGGMWKVPNSSNIPLGLASLDQYFKSMDEIETNLNSGATQAAADEEMKEDNKLIKEAKALEAQMKKNGGKLDSKAIDKIQSLGNKFQKTGSNYGIAQFAYLDFPINIQNKSSILVQTVINAKERMKEASEMIVFGYYKIKIDYTGK